MKAFIFDLDGTLLNTLEDIGQACNAVLAAHGYPTHPLAAYRRMVGNGFGRLVRSALPPAALPSTDARSAHHPGGRGSRLVRTTYARAHLSL